jgi:hypothetical protein
MRLHREIPRLLTTFVNSRIFDCPHCSFPLSYMYVYETHENGNQEE